MDFTATGSARPPGDPPVTVDKLALARWLWDRLRAAGKPLGLGQLVTEAKATRLWPDAPKGQGPNLGAFFKARRMVAELHPGWHVSQAEAPAFGGERPKKF